MKKLFLFLLLLLSCLMFSFVPLGVSQSGYEDYLEGLTPVWENDFDAGDWSGFTAHGSSCTLVTDFVDGGYFMRVNTSTASVNTYVTPSPVQNLLDWSVSFDFYVEYPDVDNDGSYSMIGFTRNGEGLADCVFLYSTGNPPENFPLYLMYKCNDDLTPAELTTKVWHHATWTNSLMPDGRRWLSYLDGVLINDYEADIGSNFNSTLFKFGIISNTYSDSVDVYIDNLKLYDEALKYEAVLPTVTPVPTQVVAYPQGDPFVAVPSYYMVLLVLFAVVAVLAGLYVTFEREQENKGVALLFVLVGLVLFVILIVGYFVGF